MKATTFHVFVMALALHALASGCGAPEIAVIEPGAPPPPLPPRAQPRQFQSVAPAEAPAVRLAPLPEPSLRVAVAITGSMDGQDRGDDLLAEGAVSEVLQAAPRPPREEGGRAPRPFQVVHRQVFEKTLGRDTNALRLRGMDLDAEILKNLAEAGVDVLAVGSVAAMGTDFAAVGRDTRPRGYSAEATISLVRVSDGGVAGTGTGSARDRALDTARREAARMAAREALRRYHEEGDRAAEVLLTIEGLRSEAEAARLESALRSTRGVLWVKPPRFQLGASAGAAGTSIARYELGLNGDPADFKEALRGLEPGFRLVGTILEGNRWTFRAEHLAAEEENQ
ncbi:MAG TPA: hypothetical protein VMT52_14255 [Planctomycetota bacterium]|nr:hypothetical protein [Planctomycetota bacterium]